MIGSLGFPEMILILVVALVLFGPTRLPELAQTLGRAVGAFRRTVQEARRTVEAEVARLDPVSREGGDDRAGAEGVDPFPYEALADQPQMPAEQERVRRGSEPGPSVREPSE